MDGLVHVCDLDLVGVILHPEVFKKLILAYRCRYVLGQPASFQTIKPNDMS